MVTRYDYMVEYEEGFIGESEDGAYVSYDDYAVLEAHAAKLEKEAERYRYWLSRMCDDN